MKNMKAQGMQWRGLRPRRRLIVLGAPVVLLLSLLLTGLALLRPAPAAHADSVTHRLEVFQNYAGVISHKWSDDRGSTWSSSTDIPILPQSVYRLEGPPAAVSDGVARLTVASGTTVPSLVTNTYNTVTNSWSGWAEIPGSSSGRVSITHDLFFTDTYSLGYGVPALTSWGPGRMEVFVYGTNLDTGARVLLHSWADNYTGSGKWEVLLTGQQGTSVDIHARPAAVSSALGRDDVFVVGVNKELEHLSFANGAWSSSWENLGGRHLRPDGSRLCARGAGRVCARYRRGAVEQVVLQWLV